MQESLIKQDELIKTAENVLEIEGNAVLELKKRMGDNFTKAIEILYSCKGKVVVTGMG